MSTADAPAHSLPAADVAAGMGSSATGLTAVEARLRLARDGSNRLREPPRPSAIRRFLAQFVDVTVVALLVAAVVAVVLAGAESADVPWLERYGDAIAISIIVMLNALIGFAQERRAESALRALADLTAPSARVLRDGHDRVVPAADVVVGDVIIMEEGDRVPADVRLVDSARLAVAEAVLTGESVPVDKDAGAVLDVDTPLADRTNLAFSGTLVVSGRGRGVAVGTGMQTELGRIAAMLSAVAVPETPLQRALRRFGTWLVLGCVVVAALVFAVGLVRMDVGLSVLVMTAVSLAVAAIPEGLPAVTTIVLALGVQRMAARNALVRRLASVETLGSAEVICTDKTGTLTENRMRVRRLATPAGGAVLAQGGELRDETGALLPLDGPLRALAWSCRHGTAAKLVEADEGTTVRGDPTDGALLLLARDLQLPPAGEVLEDVPFDAARRMATVTVAEEGRPVAQHHGAPEAVLDACATYEGPEGEALALDEAARARVAELLHDWADEGLRVLGLARGRVGEAHFLGLVGISDPPRSGVAISVARAAAAGIRTVMITGDHPRTARAIAADVGIHARDVITGSELDALSDSALSERAPSVDVVARATAAHKLRFVEALTARGAVVAMTGDGVNDAPALRAATIGVAMGRGGTDVAREAADIVLADDDYGTIVAAIEEGRIIFSNIRRFIVFLLSINAGLVIAVFAGALAGWPPLLTPTQILWINLVTNGLPALALGVESVHPDHMSRPPRKTDAGLLTRADAVWVLGHGAWMAALGIGTFAFLRGGSLVHAQTTTFVVLAIAPVFHAFSCRSRSRTLWSIGALSNRGLVHATLVAFVLQAIAVYGPFQAVFRTTALTARELGVALGLAFTQLLMGEIEKLIRRSLGSTDFD